MLSNLLRILTGVVIVSVTIAPIFSAPPTVAAATLDWSLPDGHFFTQTGGYTISNQAGIPMWSEFQRLGGVDAVGYPASQRFQWNGYTVQTMQRVVMQWRPEVNQAYYVNVFDLMTAAGKDDWLLNTRQTPKPLPASFDAGKPWEQVVNGRLALLDENPAIKEKYFSVNGDPLQLNGLPTSHVVDMGSAYVLRAQRVVFQQWKQDMPWAYAGQVTVALGGDLAKEAGLIPAAAAKTEAIESPALAAINSYRAAAGVAPARLNPALMKAAQAHANYYDANRGDPSLSGALHINPTNGVTLCASAISAQKGEGNEYGQ